jgi:archaemetzincin
MPLPEDAFDYDAQKYVAMYVLRELINVDVPEGAKILGVANVDLFTPESDTDYVFGQHQYGRKSKAAIISVYRMNPFSYVGGKRNDELLVQRMIKEAVHELGGVFGLLNCIEPECVMYLPTNLKSLDKKTDNFCINCQKEYRALQQSESELQPPE